MQWDQGRGRSRRSRFIWTSKRKKGKVRAVYLHQWPQDITLPLSCLLFINPLSSKHSTLQLFPVRDKVGRMWFHKLGKWEFQTGWCHAIRDSGQESKLPCSFYVWLNTLCVCVCVCVCTQQGFMLEPQVPLSLLWLTPCSLLRKLMGFDPKGVDIFLSSFKIISFWSMLDNGQIVFHLSYFFCLQAVKNVFCLLHSHFYSSTPSSLAHGCIYRGLPWWLRW